MRIGRSNAPRSSNLRRRRNASISAYTSASPASLPPTTMSGWASPTTNFLVGGAHPTALPQSTRRSHLPIFLSGNFSVIVFVLPRRWLWRVRSARCKSVPETSSVLAANWLGLVLRQAATVAFRSAKVASLRSSGVLMCRWLGLRHFCGHRSVILATGSNHKYTYTHECYLDCTERSAMTPPAFGAGAS